jgi:hypothetical protein
VTEFFQKDHREIPNNKLIRQVFEHMDFNKDGMLDQNEWSKGLGIHGVQTLLK